MNIFRDMAEGITRGLFTQSANGGSGQEHGRIERLCREVGYSIHDRQNDYLYLHFMSADGCRRTVRIGCGDIDYVPFIVYSLSCIPAADVPPQIISYLLRRNLQVLIGAWLVGCDGENPAVFGVTYYALGAGLTASTFQFCCESMLREVTEFDVKLRLAGLLQLLAERQG